MIIYSRKMDIPKSDSKDFTISPFAACADFCLGPSLIGSRVFEIRQRGIQLSSALPISHLKQV